MTFIVRHKISTTLIYLSAAFSASCFWLSRNRPDGTWSGTLLFSLLFFAVPLLFVFAYPRFLFAVAPPTKNRLVFAAILHGLGLASTTFVFSVAALPFWKNPVRDSDSLALLLVPLIALPVFLVAAISLLLKNKSTLTTFAWFVFWLYWLLLALVSVNRFFEDTTFRTIWCFLCLAAAILFAFAAGAVSYRPTFAHATALAGLVSLPWIYWSTLRGSELSNDWITFNIPDKIFGFRYSIWPTAALTILSIALIVLAIATAALRLLPARWCFRKSPISERTWPAFTAAFLFLAVWFSRSVMPYRIPGAVDYADWPILKILHVEKHGLQFHETCINVRRDSRIYVSENRRRLFQYRFEQAHSEGQLSQPLMQRVLAIVQSGAYSKSQGEAIRPVRSWNADNWYFRVEGSSIVSYTSDMASTPPAEIVALFHDLEAMPRSSLPPSELRDVCFGFCYDPPAGLGLLFSNHRCSNDGHSVVCR
ncbi:MAG TPA: hypothetical protein VI431_16295 [Candidatus Acidoferrum sp.]